MNEVEQRVAGWSSAGLDVFDSLSLWLPMSTASVTTAYSVPGKVAVVLADATGGAFTVTLPAASLRKNQMPIIVKRLNSGANAVTVASAGGTIDGAASQPLGSQYAVLRFVSDGTNWYTI